MEKLNKFFTSVFSISIYLLTFCIILVICLVYVNEPRFHGFSIHSKIMYSSILLGGVGGITYLLRAIYLNRSVKNKWDPNYATWYYLRPFTSLIAGGIAFLFIKAGLIIFESESINEASNYAIYAFAFIAGLNVSNFMEKIEETGKVAFGINKSNSSKEKQNNQENKENNNLNKNEEK